MCHHEQNEACPNNSQLSQSGGRVSSLITCKTHCLRFESYQCPFERFISISNKNQGIVDTHRASYPPCYCRYAATYCRYAASYCKYAASYCRYADIYSRQCVAHIG